MGKALLCGRGAFIMGLFLALFFPLIGYAGLDGDGATFVALAEDDNKIEFRGGKILYELPLPKMRLLIKAPPSVGQGKGGLPAMLKRLQQMIEPAGKLSEADAALLLASSPRAEATASVLDSKGRSFSGRDFSLPEDEKALEAHLAGLARAKAVRELRGAGAFPPLTCTIHVHHPAGPETPVPFISGGRSWALSKTLDVSGGDAAVGVEGPVLLYFSFRNDSREDYYVYLINYTDKGQILPVLPPGGGQSLDTLVPWGKVLTLPSVCLELEAPVERLRLIVSRVPLNISSLGQASVLDGTVPSSGGEERSFVHSGQFSTLEVVFSLNNGTGGRQ